MGPSVPSFLSIPEDGGHEGWDERSWVDGEVEDWEECLQLALLLGELELVAAERGDAWLDAAGADGDQGEAWKWGLIVALSSLLKC